MVDFWRLLATYNIPAVTRRVCSGVSCQISQILSADFSWLTLNRTCSIFLSRLFNYDYRNSRSMLYRGSDVIRDLEWVIVGR